MAHEAWHVVQQMQGRVKPTMQMKGVKINDDEGLEREADVMGKNTRIEEKNQSWSWGRQESIAHEFAHVVQQNRQNISRR